MIRCLFTFLLVFSGSQEVTAAGVEIGPAYEISSNHIFYYDRLNLECTFPEELRVHQASWFVNGQPITTIFEFKHHNKQFIERSLIYIIAAPESENSSYTCYGKSEDSKEDIVAEWTLRIRAYRPLIASATVQNSAEFTRRLNVSSKALYLVISCHVRDVITSRVPVLQQDDKYQPCHFSGHSIFAPGYTSYTCFKINLLNMDIFEEPFTCEDPGLEDLYILSRIDVNIVAHDFSVEIRRDGRDLVCEVISDWPVHHSEYHWSVFTSTGFEHLQTKVHRLSMENMTLNPLPVKCVADFVYLASPFSPPPQSLRITERRVNAATFVNQRIAHRTREMLTTSGTTMISDREAQSGASRITTPKMDPSAQTFKDWENIVERKEWWKFGIAVGVPVVVILGLAVTMVISQWIRRKGRRVLVD